jgi:hypothetical protein
MQHVLICSKFLFSPAVLKQLGPDFAVRGLALAWMGRGWDGASFFKNKSLLGQPMGGPVQYYSAGRCL